MQLNFWSEYNFESPKIDELKSLDSIIIIMY